MGATTGTIFVILAILSGSNGMQYMPLDIDNQPCSAENLKRAQSYICSPTGEILCQSGWQEPVDPSKRDAMNPCPEPICKQNCTNGMCISPDQCACSVGWEGRDCNTCIPYPGCVHGHCVQALECICDPGYAGAFCDVPDCGDCNNGYCASPNDCVCFDGWKGTDCAECIPMAGCVNGKCTDHPHTCNCSPGWEGALCDTPICEPSCVHGTCMIGINGTDNFCLCEMGWKSEACNSCVPYWQCPNQEKNACLLPNECHCPEDTQDPKGLCAPPLILTDEHLQLLDKMILESDSSALKVEAVEFPKVPTMPSLDVKQKNEVEENT